MSSYQVRTTGKWILAGEHAVLRGSPALVFPLRSRALELTYTRSADAKSDRGLELSLSGEHGDELQILFWGVLDKACELKKIKRSQFDGRVQIQSGIPVGAGLGASAALCVAITKWLSFLNVLPESEISEFARTLENLFHGESSGVDIAVAVKGKPLRFLRGEPPVEIPLAWTPKLYVSYSGQRGVTLECVNQVKRLHETDPAGAKLLDQKMREAVSLCERALQTNEAEGFELLAKSINEASMCFRDWGLVDGAPLAHANWLREQGAVAVKPTGSGKGGYFLSLWRSEPPAELKAKLISCF